MVGEGIPRCHVFRLRHYRAMGKFAMRKRAQVGKVVTDFKMIVYLKYFNTAQVSRINVSRMIMMIRRPNLIRKVSLYLSRLFRLTG